MISTGSTPPSAVGKSRAVRRHLLLLPLLPLLLLTACTKKLPAGEVYRSGERIVRILGDGGEAEVVLDGKPAKGALSVDDRTVRIAAADGRTFRLYVAKDGLEEEGGKVLLSRTVRKERSEAARKALAASMKKIPGGGFLMGVHGVEPDENPVHKVTLSPFEMAETEVTQELWEGILGTNPSAHKGAKLPVEQVSHADALAFVEELNAIEGGGKYRLPTEAEWEYGARGGSNETWYFGNDPAGLPKAGWFSGNSNGTSHEVGGLEANRYGLKDVTGNVWEWTADRYGSYPVDPSVDPKGPSTGGMFVRRGGGWANDGKACRVTNRDPARPESRHDDVGFRLAR